MFIIANPDGVVLTSLVMSLGLPVVLKSTETIGFSDVVAIAEVRRHTFIRKAFRSLVIFGRRVRGFLVRRFLVKR